MSNISLNLFRLFCVVAQSKSMAEAGKKLNLTKSTVCSSMKKLEDYLEAKLFDRNQDGITLTKNGKELYQMINREIENIEVAEKIMLDKTDLSNGKISIGSQSHIIEFLLLEIIKKAGQEYPGLNIKMISNASSIEMIELLKNRKVDFVIMGTIPEKYRDDDRLVIKPIKKEKHIFISKEPIKLNTAKDLEKMRVIISSEYTNTTKNLLKRLSENNVYIKPKIECDITEVRISSVKEGLGIGYVMEDSVKKELENKELYEVEIPNIELPDVDISLIYNKGILTKVDKSFLNKYLNLN